MASRKLLALAVLGCLACGALAEVTICNSAWEVNDISVNDETGRFTSKKANQILSRALFTLAKRQRCQLVSYVPLEGCKNTITTPALRKQQLAFWGLGAKVTLRCPRRVVKVQKWLLEVTANKSGEIKKIKTVHAAPWTA